MLLLDITDIIMSKLFNLTQQEGLYNLRAKLYPDHNGEWRVVEEMCSSSPIFNPDGLESSEESCCASGSNPTSDADKLNRSRARAKSKVRDLLMCNDWRWFVTLTLSPEKVDDRKDYKAIIKRLNTYLGNRVRRNGLYYVGVCEAHKDGALHFHFVMNDCLSVADSGTYIRPSGGKPVKPQTVYRSGYTLDQCRKVYNVVDWSLGFTTAIETYGRKEQLGNYILKYITKGQKVGGRWYFSGGLLTRPRFVYSRIDFDTFDADYRIQTPACEILTRYYRLPES